MEKRSTIAGDAQVDNNPDTVSLQPGDGNPSFRMPVLHFGMGWILDGRLVFLHGYNGRNMVCGRTCYSSAVEFFTSYIQSCAGCSDGQANQ